MKNSFDNDGGDNMTSGIMFITRKAVVLAGLFVVLQLYFSSLLAAADIVAPDVMLKQTSDEVIAVIKQKREQLEQDPSLVYDLVHEYILPHLDEVTIAKLALGKNWRAASREQKIEFINEFRNLLIRTYGKSLSEFSDQEINYFPVRLEEGDEKVVVKSEVLQPGGPSIPVSYRMRIKDDAWKVYDLSIDGVSLVTSYRGTFDQEVRKGGIEGLLKYLKGKNTKKVDS
jgi:phospholipid transport system substrate-binding protein